ncbi:MAG: Ig-like domain-containing protein, partial [Erysipelotrichaceae bacterium]|nr:Ig-like domain-containing protein [Erysipelotrichaceae bacterium]
MYRKLLTSILALLICFGYIPTGSVKVLAEDDFEHETIYLAEECVHDEDDDSDENLLEGYINDVFSISKDNRKSSKNNGDKLTGLNRTLYAFLVTCIRETAAGQRASTVYEISLDDLGIQTVFTADDLGVEIMIDGQLNQDAKNKALEVLVFDLSLLNTTLLLDHPYELYWYDKTKGVSYSRPLSISYSSVQLMLSGSIVFRFNVANEYAGSADYTVNTEIGTTVTKSVNNAQMIVRNHTDEVDYQKIKSYKDEICDLVSYNNDAAGGGVDYGNPWQLVWVFDNDPDTNVVCEGYSKAFQYLCDSSSFIDNLVCYTVSGEMDGGTGAGPHMWNIVNAHDGQNYLVDVTNCDSGTVGEDYRLFMTGVPEDDTNSSVDNGYTFKPNGYSILYIYDAKIRDIYSDDELTIARGDYIPVEQDVPVMVSSISLDKTSVSLKSDESIKLNATVLPENASNKTLLWSSSNENVAIVNQDGKVAAVAAGTAVITVETTEGNPVSALCQVTVTPAEHIVDESLEYTTITYAYAFNFDRERYDHTGHASSAEKENTKLAIKNQYFRLAVQAAMDLFECSQPSPNRTSFNPYDVDVLTDGRIYGEIVRDEYVDYLSPYIDESVNLKDGYNGLYDPDRAMQYIALAQSQGVQFPVTLDFMTYDSATPLLRAYKLKNSIESATQGNILINITVLDNFRDYANCTRYVDSVSEIDCDFFQGVGWEPERLDPLDNVRILCKENVLKTSDLSEHESLIQEIGLDVLNDMIEDAASYYYSNEYLAKAAKAEAYALSRVFTIPFATNEAVKTALSCEYMVMSVGETRKVEFNELIDETYTVDISLIGPLNMDNYEENLDVNDYIAFDEERNITALKEGYVTLEIDLNNGSDYKTEYQRVVILPEEQDHSINDYGRVYSIEYYLIDDELFSEYNNIAGYWDYQSAVTYFFHKFVTEGEVTGVIANKGFDPVVYMNENPVLAGIYGDSDYSIYYTKYLNGYQEENQIEVISHTTTYDVSSGQAYYIVLTGTLDDIRNIVINGSILAEDQYTITEENGQITIEISNEVMENITEENNEIIVEFTDGISVVEVEVDNESKPVVIQSSALVLEGVIQIQFKVIVPEAEEKNIVVKFEGGNASNSYEE